MNETLFLCKYFKMLAFIFIIRFLKWFFDEFFILKRLLLHVISIFAAQKYFLRNHFMFGLLEPEKNCWYKKGTHTNKQPTNISKYFKPWWVNCILSFDTDSVILNPNFTLYKHRHSIIKVNILLAHSLELLITCTSQDIIVWLF
jgi:hypothetical protein